MSLTTFGEKLELRSEVEIAASSERIWQKLTTFAELSTWNPFIVRAEGNIITGDRVILTVALPGGREVTVKRLVKVVDEPQQLRWSGGYGWGLLVRSEQYFLLKPTDLPNITRLIVGENLVGPGVTGNNAMVMNIARGLALMNQALKQKLECAQEARTGNDRIRG